MSGQNGFAVEQLKKVDTILDEYENAVGVLNPKVNREAERYFEITQGELAKLTSDQLGEAAIALAQFAYHLQKMYNKEVTRVNWAEANIKNSIGPRMKQQGAASADERRILAIAESEYAKKLDQIRREAQARIDRTAFLANRVEFLSKTFIELQQSKRKQNNGG